MNNNTCNIILVICSMLLYKKLDNDKYKYAILVVTLLAILLNKKRKNINYLLSVAVGKIENSKNKMKGVLVNIYNNKPLLFIPTEKGKKDMLLDLSNNKPVDVIDNTNISSLDNTISVLPYESNNGYSDLIITRENDVSLYKNNGNGNFKKIPLLSNNNDLTNKPVGIMLTNLNERDSVKNVVSSDCPFAKVFHFIVNNDGANKLVKITKNSQAYKKLGHLLSHLKLIKRNIKKKLSIENFDGNINSIVMEKNINEKITNISSYSLGNREGLPDEKNTWINIPCINKIDYTNLNNLNLNYSLGSDFTKKNRQQIVNLMNNKVSSHYIASYDKGARSSDYYDIDVNVYKAPINIGLKNNQWKKEPCIKNLEYNRTNNQNQNYSLGINKLQGDGYSFSGNESNISNLMTVPSYNDSPIRSYTLDKRGNKVNSKLYSSKNSCVKNRPYNRNNNEKKNYGHNILKNALAVNDTSLLNNKSNNVNLIKTPKQNSTYSVSYYSMNRLQ